MSQSTLPARTRDLRDVRQSVCSASSAWTAVFRWSIVDARDDLPLGARNHCCYSLEQLLDSQLTPASSAAGIQHSTLLARFTTAGRLRGLTVQCKRFT